MLPSRFAPAQQSAAARKSRYEGKPSLLPVAKERQSAEARRPSAAGHRSSSAEPVRSTFGGGRLSREASATKLPNNKRSRSQQGQASMTPLRPNQYLRPTITPVTTPSAEDRSRRSWQTSLERALAFVTIKDQRPISSAAWQRSELVRVQEALARRGAGAGTGGAPMTLVRPLTIARFVDITNALLVLTDNKVKLNNDNYTTKLPHLSKRLLYPGQVSKSWLKTVNTLHAYPHALALIAYLLDMAEHIEMPMSDEWLYCGKDEHSRLRRDYCNKCWIRFQEDPQYDDLVEEYLNNLNALLGIDEEQINELQQVIKNYESCLEDEAELSARAEEARLSERKVALASALRAERAARRDLQADLAAQRTRARDLAEDTRALDADIERANLENQQLRVEVESQSLSVAERNRLLDEIDYANRVLDSKRALAEQIAKMVQSKETELAQWQNKTLDSCLQYKQGLIHLSAQFPHLTLHAVDEKELMGDTCMGAVSRAVEALRAISAELAERRAACNRHRSTLARRQQLLLEEARTSVLELKTSIDRVQNALETEQQRENAESVSCHAALEQMKAKVEQIQKKKAEYAAVEAELRYWEQQDDAWRTRLEEARQYVALQREHSEQLLQEARQKRAAFLLARVHAWTHRLEQH